MGQTVAAKLAAFAAGMRLADVPAGVLDRTKVSLFHSLAVGLAGHSIEFARIARETVSAYERVPAGATVLPFGERVAPGAAAFANAVCFHSRAQEDGHHLARVHPGPVVIPVALALAETSDASGSTLLEAQIVGYEIAVRVGRDHGIALTARGFRATPVCGAVGAAAAAAKLMRLDARQTQQAIAGACSFTGGTSECFRAGTMEWRFQAGIAARTGILAAQLARHGLQSAPAAIEGRNGLARAFAGSTDHAEAVSEDLGRRWELLEVTQKPYPTGGNSQPRIEAMLELVQRHGVTHDQIERIVDTINAHEGAYPGVDHKGPFGSLGAALMNPRFCVATAAVHGAVTVAHLQRLDDARVLDLVQKIDLRFDESIPEFSSRLEVVLKDGRRLRAERIDAGPSYKFSMERAAEVARSLQPEMPISRERLDAVLEIVRTMESQPTVHRLVQACTVPDRAESVRGS